MAEGHASREDDVVPHSGDQAYADLPRRNMLPLNSKRLTKKLMKQLAVALEVPTSATPDDLRQLISGRLEEMEREPMNVQVLVQETPPQIVPQPEGHGWSVRPSGAPGH